MRGHFTQESSNYNKIAGGEGGGALRGGSDRLKDEFEDEKSKEDIEKPRET